MEEKKEVENIKLIALDLDGTTLTRSGLTRRTKETLEEAINRGIDVVIATGRTFTALPKKIHEIKGLEYIITSNGAHITSVKTGNFIYSNYVSPEAIPQIVEVLRNTQFPTEVFTNGKAYIDRKVYDDLAQNGSTYMSARYVLRTRTPVDGIYDFLLQNQNSIENINIHFEFMNDRAKLWHTLEKIKGITVTSSFPHNVEIGGETTSKATALLEICKMKNIDLSHIMAFGDSPNDKAMLMEAGFGVAMANATDDVKCVADYITISNDEEGVAFTIRKLLFKEKDGVAGKRELFFERWIKKARNRAKK